MPRLADPDVGFLLAPLRGNARRATAIALAVATIAPAIGAADPETRGPTGPFGFSGNSGNDTLTVFDLTTGVAVGADIDLLPEGNYPYDTTIHPDGSEVWICGAVGDGVIVIDTTPHANHARISQTGSAYYPADVALTA
ncbi:MAG: hypothetical protein GY778_10315, partial [bacterium]|nr:hypothetical protein [bacterium]